MSTEPEKPQAGPELADVARYAADVAAELMQAAGIILVQSAALRKAMVWYLPAKLEAAAEIIQRIARHIYPDNGQSAGSADSTQVSK